jgi:hypothetical protein
MGTTRKGAFRSLAVFTALAALVSVTYAQNTIQFTSVNATSEKAVQLHWASNSNELYEVDYADSLIDTNTGTITWNKLYDLYPSHGTNTFIADAGNYDSDPIVVHPKYSPMRFYRIVNLGQNDGTNPTVSITVPSDGTTLTGEATITVSAYSDAILSGVKLYVDGEEQYDSDDGTNFVINTCEWDNGPHVLFAVAKSQSDFTGLPGQTSVTYGSAVSSYVTVNFSNLITRWDFSELFFQPENGQTQTVTATFAANCDWTIQVQDENSNVVRSATGSGASMSWIFDGRDTNGNVLTPGLYWYLLDAETNGLDSLIASGGGSGDGGGVPSPSFASSGFFSGDSDDTTQLWAQSANGSVAPLALYPPGFDTNDFTIFEEPLSWSPFENSLSSESFAAMDSSGGGASPAAAGYSGPSGQNSKGPQRNPKQRHIGVTGNFGVLYTDGALYCPPPTLLTHLPPYYVKIDGDPVGANLAQPAQPEVANIAKAFVTGMKNSGYTNSFLRGSGKWSASDLSGNSASINSVNLGLLISHASYAETVENPADQILHTYIWLSGGTYVHLNDMRLGAGGNLRWMTMLTCDTLRDQNISTYVNRGWMSTIINDNLHLLLGANTIISGSQNTTSFYAANLKKKQTIPSAWYNALRDSLKGATLSGPRVAKVMGHNPCFGDKLMDFVDPDPGIFSQTNQVWP